jgi:hypothetical protein
VVYWPNYYEKASLETSAIMARKEDNSWLKKGVFLIPMRLKPYLALKAGKACILTTIRLPGKGHAKNRKI